MMHRNLRAALFAAAAAVAGFAAPHAFAQNATEEVVRQTSRQVSDAISRRVGDVSAASVSLQAQDQRPKEQRANDSIWFQQSFDRITPDDTTSFDYEVDIYQSVLGGDMRHGRFLFGASGGIARATVSSNIGERTAAAFTAAGLGTGDATAASLTSSFGGDSNTYSISPYGAYIIDDRFFLMGLASYQRAAPDGSGTQSNTLLSDVSVNARGTIASWFIEGRAGYRFAHTWLANANNGGDQDSHTPYVNVKGGYDLGMYKPFASFGYEREFSSGGAFGSTSTSAGTVPVGTPSFTSSSDLDKNRAFVGAGLAFEPIRDIVFEFAFSAEVLNSDTDQMGGYGRVQFRF